MRIVLLVVAMSVVAAATARPLRAVDLSSGRAEVLDTLGTGEVVRVVVRVDAQDRTAPLATLMWGADEHGPAITHIGALSIEWGGESAWVPLSAYADLGAPSTLDLASSRHGISLVLSGGEAGTSYRAQFFVDRGVLKRRRVSHAEFPEVWEETTYSGPNKSAR